MDDENTLKARQIMADLDAVGNTTKAITKGVAIASAVIAAVSLFASFITDVGRAQAALGVPVMESIRVSDTGVFVRLLLGGALPWLLASLSIRSVSRAAGQIVDEVRRQFRIPGIMEGTRQPDYASFVGVSTASAQKELIPLATISVLTPLFVGLVLQVEALGRFLYAASKSFVLSFSESLAEELRGTRVTVTAVCPGLTNSEMADAALERAPGVAPYRALMFAEAADVARAAVADALEGQALVVPAAANQLYGAMIKAAPRAARRRLTALFGRALR